MGVEPTVAAERRRPPVLKTVGLTGVLSLPLFIFNMLPVVTFELLHNGRILLVWPCESDAARWRFPWLHAFKMATFTTHPVLGT